MDLLGKSVNRNKEKSKKGRFAVGRGGLESKQLVGRSVRYAALIAGAAIVSSPASKWNDKNCGAIQDGAGSRLCSAN
jgi:hypothetical protein